MNKNTAHLSLEFPIEQHLQLKVMCVRQRRSIKDFVIEAVMNAMKEYDAKVLEGIDQGLKDIKAGKVIYRDASEFEKNVDE